MLNLNHAMITRSKMIACISLMLTLLGCGGSGQEKSEASASPRVIQGMAIDGYLARATVFVDYDNNRTRDPWEPFAFTDDHGYFSYNPLTQTDYCATGATEDQRLFCLQSNRNLRETLVRIDGGYDVMTGEPFFGQLSRRIERDQQSPIIISPLTSLLADVRTESQRTAILTALNITSNDLDQDYLNTENSGNISISLLNLALRLHKTVSLISHFIQDRYREVGSQAGSMNDVSADVYHYLALQLANGNQSLDDITENPATIGYVIAQTELKVLDYYDKWEIPLPAEGSSSGDIAALTDRTAGLSQLINSVLNENVSSIANIGGAVKLIEAMSLKASGYNRATFRTSIDHLLDAGNSHVLDELIATLTEENSDLTALVRLDFASSLNSSEAARAATLLPPGTHAFSDIADKQMRVSDMDLGSAPNNLRDSEIELYFRGNSGNTRGAFDACIKYIKDASVTGKLGDANTRGELVKGHWSLLGATDNNGASYSLLLTFQLLGTTYQAILKPAASATFNATEFSGIRFDYANELRTWYSERGIEPIQSPPQNAAGCAARLPSRIGI